MIFISQIKLIKRTKKLELNLNIDLARSSVGGKLWKLLFYSLLKMERQKSSHLTLLFGSS